MLIKIQCLVMEFDTVRYPIDVFFFVSVIVTCLVGEGGSIDIN